MSLAQALALVKVICKGFSTCKSFAQALALVRVFCTGISTCENVALPLAKDLTKS